MFFDDMPVGKRFETASHEMTEAEIVEFALKWDAQPFHIDPAAAAVSVYGGIIASGWHTLLVAFNLVLGAADWSESSMGSPGMADVKWRLPVRPGDILRVEAEVAAAKPSRSKPDRGFVEVDYTIFNQKGETVASYRATHMLKRRRP